MSDTSSVSSVDVEPRLVHFLEGDDVVEYKQAAKTSQTEVSQPSTPSTSTSYARGLSEALDSLTAVPLMSEELLASFEQPWGIFDFRDDFWDDFHATTNNVKRITLYIEGLPSPITVEPAESNKAVLVGDVYRTILDYLTTEISDDDDEYAQLDDKAKAKVMQKFLLRRSKSSDSKLQRHDFLLERQIFKCIVPFAGGEAWKVQFSEI